MRLENGKPGDPPKKTEKPRKRASLKAQLSSLTESSTETRFVQRFLSDASKIAAQEIAKSLGLGYYEGSGGVFSRVYP